MYGLLIVNNFQLSLVYFLNMLYNLIGYNKELKARKEKNSPIILCGMVR